MAHDGRWRGAGWTGVSVLTAAEVAALDGPPGGGTESNRARAARGGPMGADVLSVYLDGQRIAGAPMDRVEVAGVRCGCGAYPGQDHWSDCSALERPGDHESPTGPRCTCGLPPDGTGGHARGCPARPTSAAWSGAVPGPVVSLPSTLAEAERLYGKGSPVWEAVRACDLAGVAPPLAASAQPTPAPGQVWLPPVGASGHPPGWVDLDGTVTVADSPATAVDGLYRLTRGGTVTAEVLQRGQCIGVATPHGRVMVGDAFCFEDGHQRDVLAVLSGTTIDLDGRRIDAADIVTQAERWRYAPARAGERYRHRTERRTVQIVPDRQWMLLREEDSSDLYALRAGGGLDPAQWERLDPGAALPEHESTMAFAIQMANELRAKLSPQSKVGAYEVKPARAPTAYEHVAAEFAKWDRVLSVGAADRESDVALRDRCIVADWRRAAMAPGLDTATGTALDAIASGMGIERRAAVGPSGPAPAFDYGGNIKGPPSVDYDVATKTITRIHLAAGQTYVSGKGTDLRRHTLVRTDDGEAWATEEGVVVLESFIREACRFVGMKADLLAAAANVGFVNLTVDPGASLTLAAPAPDLRALFDAIGRALEATTGQLCHFAGHVLRVQRDELLFTPTWSTGIGASLCGDARALCALRATVGEAMVTGAATLAQWGAKGPALVVRREGGPVASPVAADPAATRYDGANGGADQWRWTPRGEGC